MASPCVVLCVTLPNDAAAADIRLRIEALCRPIEGASVVCLSEESAALGNVAHRGANERVEALFCEGLYENREHALKVGLPAVSQAHDACLSTRDLATCDSLSLLVGRPLRNTTHGNLGADMVILTASADASKRFDLHLVQLKRGKTPLSYPKSTCGSSNKNRSVYYIHKGLADIGKELTAALKARTRADVEDVTCHYYLMTKAGVRPQSRVFLRERDVLIIDNAADLVALLPKRLQADATTLL